MVFEQPKYIERPPHSFSFFKNRHIKDRNQTVKSDRKTMSKERSEDYYYECIVAALPWLSCSLSKTSA